MNAEQRREWRRYVFGCTDLTVAHRLVLLALETFADWPAGTNARPGVARLADLCGLKTSVVEKALARGRGLELIQQTARANPRRGLAAVYRLVPVPASTRTDIQVEEDSTLTDIRVDDGFNPYETKVQPVRDDDSTRPYVQPTYPLTPIHVSTYGGGGDEVIDAEIVYDSPSSPPTPDHLNQSANRKRVPLPVCWQPVAGLLDEMRCKYPSLDVADELEAFADKATAEGWVAADWNARFRDWLRRAEKWRIQDEKAPSIKATGTDQRVARVQRLKDDYLRMEVCTDCDDHGWLLGEDGQPAEPASRCTHLRSHIGLNTLSIAPLFSGNTDAASSA